MPGPCQAPWSLPPSGAERWGLLGSLQPLSLGSLLAWQGCRAEPSKRYCDEMRKIRFPKCQKAWFPFALTVTIPDELCELQGQLRDEAVAQAARPWGAELCYHNMDKAFCSLLCNCDTAWAEKLLS